MVRGSERIKMDKQHCQHLRIDAKPRLRAARELNH